MTALSITTPYKKLRSILLPFVWLFCFISSSCTDVTSIYPLSENDQDRVVRSELEGTWVQPDDEGTEGEYTEVKQRADSLYELLVVHKAYDSLPARDTNYFIGTLVQIDQYLFLDCVADLERLPPKRGGVYAMLLMRPTHFIGRLKIRNHQTVELYYLSNNNLEEVLKKNKVSNYFFLWDMVLLEPSANLKKLLVQLVKKHPEVWEKMTLLRRASLPAAPHSAGKQVKAESFATVLSSSYKRHRSW